MGDLKLAISTSSLGMDHTLWDALTVEVSQEVDEVKVLKQQRAWLRAKALPRGRVLDRTAIGGGVDRLLVVAVRGLVVGDHDDDIRVDRLQ